MAVMYVGRAKQCAAVVAALVALSVAMASAQAPVERHVGALTLLARPNSADNTVAFHASWADGRSSDFTLLDVSEPPPATIPMRLYSATRLLIYTEGHLYIVDALAGSVIDNFYFLGGPRFSPDGRYVAFQRTISRGSSFGDAVYLVYDLEQTASANQMIPGGPFTGIAVFPEENRAMGLYHAAADESQGHQAQSPIVWISNRQFVFVDNLGEATKVVLVDVSQGATAAQVKEIVLNPTAVIYPERLATYQSPAKELNAEAIELVSAVETGITVRLRFHNASMYRVSSVDVRFTLP